MKCELGISVKVQHYNSDDWCKDKHARTQEQLVEIAGKIRKTCRVEDICDPGDYGTCTVYVNEALGIRYWVRDDFGHIEEIVEGRYYN